MNEQFAVVDLMTLVNPRITGGMIARVSIIGPNVLDSVVAVYDLMRGKQAAYWSDNMIGGSKVSSRAAYRALLADRVGSLS